MRIQSRPENRAGLCVSLCAGLFAYSGKLTALRFRSGSRNSGQADCTTNGRAQAGREEWGSACVIQVYGDQPALRGEVQCGRTGMDGSDISCGKRGLCYAAESAGGGIELPHMQMAKTRSLGEHGIQDFLLRAPCNRGRCRWKRNLSGLFQMRRRNEAKDRQRRSKALGCNQQATFAVQSERAGTASGPTSDAIHNRELPRRIGVRTEKVQPVCAEISSNAHEVLPDKYHRGGVRTPLIREVRTAANLLQDRGGRSGHA